MTLLNGLTSLLFVVVSCFVQYGDSALFDSVFVQFGNNLGDHVINQLQDHLSKTSDRIFEYQPDIVSKEGTNNSLILAFGNTTLTSSIIAADELSSLPAESFIVRSQYESHYLSEDGKLFSRYILAANGLPLSDKLGRNSSLDRNNIHYGAILGSYHILELLGYAWMHPLSPMAPARMRLQETVANQVMCQTNARSNVNSANVEAMTSSPSSGLCVGGLNITESPRWPHRAFHLHTQHPIELTEVLQGFDIPQQGTHGPRCSHFSKHAHGGFSPSSSNDSFPDKYAFLNVVRKTFGATSMESLTGTIGREDAEADELWKQLWVDSSASARSRVGSSNGSHASSSDGSLHMQGHQLHHESDWTSWWSDVTRSYSTIANGDSDLSPSSVKGGDVNGDSSGGGGGGGYCERWEDMVNEVNLFFEWSLVNRLNKVEWLLLGNYKWDNHVHTRQHRLAVLVSLGHQYSIVVGGNSPLGNIQQHGWFMTDTSLTYAQQVEQVKSRVDWVFEAGFDFLTTESGSSEFTHPECGLMLDLMNVYADYVDTVWGREAGIKVHCSTGQICEEFPDPRTGEPINFNFLPTYATPALGVYPHTIQVYAMNDPTNGVYGNDNFSHMEDYLVFEAKRKPETGRIVLYYGETSYWVNADIDVPLFLPLFAQRRQADLQRIARREDSEGFHIDGQMNFDSGWEWSYWLNDVVTARASWDPMISITDPWEAFEASLKPFLVLFPLSVGIPLGQVLVDLTKVQEKLFVYGDITYPSSATSSEAEGKECFTNSSASGSCASKDYYSDLKQTRNSNKLSGLAYLQGDDTWIDLPRMMGLHLLQPDKVHLQETDDPLWPQVLVLLSAMEEALLPLHARMRVVLLRALKLVDDRPSTEFGAVSGDLAISSSAFELVLELHDSLTVLLLRVQQAHKLYRSRGKLAEVSETTAELQVQSRELIRLAASVVVEREKQYRVHVNRIGAWRENPTVYRYGYLWSVHSLYYWWRDQGIAEAGTVQAASSPCYLNRMDTTEVAMGFGKSLLSMLRAFVNKYSPFVLGFPLELVNCAAPAPREYIFPRDLYHYD